MNDQIKESDWKIYKKLRPLALQRYCERVLGDVDKVIRNSGLSVTCRSVTICW